MKATLKGLKLQNTTDDGVRGKEGTGDKPLHDAVSYTTPHSRHRGGCFDTCMIKILPCSVPVVLGKPKRGRYEHIVLFYRVNKFCLWTPRIRTVDLYSLARDRSAKFFASFYGRKKPYSTRARYRSAKFRLLSIPLARIVSGNSFYRVTFPLSLFLFFCSSISLLH